jgi:streptogramin lyase
MNPAALPATRDFVDSSGVRCGAFRRRRAHSLQPTPRSSNATVTTHLFGDVESGITMQMSRPRGRGWIGVLVVAASLVVVASAYPRDAARSGSATKVPCAKLKRQHRKLPARCRKKQPVPTLPSVGSVVARIPVQDGPTGLVAVPGAVWVAAHHGRSIARIDPASNTVVAHVPVGKLPGQMVFADGTLFEVDYSGPEITLVDPLRNSIESVVQAPYNSSCCSPAYAAGSLWLLGASTSNEVPDLLARLDTSGHLLMSMPLASPGGLVFGSGAVWGSADGKVFRLDPNVNQITARIATTAVPTAYGAGSVWGITPNAENLVRIDPATNTVAATIHMPELAAEVVATDTAVWVTQGPPGGAGAELWKIDPATNKVVGHVTLGVSGVIDDVVVSDDGSVWVSLFDANLVLRVRPN